MAVKASQIVYQHFKGTCSLSLGMVVTIYETIWCHNLEDHKLMYSKIITHTEVHTDMHTHTLSITKLQK